MVVRVPTRENGVDSSYHDTSAGVPITRTVGELTTTRKDVPPDVTENLREERAVVTAAGEIDLATSPALRTRLQDAIARHRTVIVDLSDVTFIDSTGLGVLIGGLRRVNEAGGQMAIVIADPRVLKIFEITGLTGLFSIHQSLSEAEAAST
jgi:anti-sigma B factor antagonist